MGTNARRTLYTLLILAGIALVWWGNKDEWEVPHIYEGPIDMESFRKTFETPIMSPDEWEAQCNPMKGKAWGNERLDSHCTIQVVVDCPPDCGVYKILREDKLLRRVY